MELGLLVDIALKMIELTRKRGYQRYPRALRTYDFNSLIVAKLEGRGYSKYLFSIYLSIFLSQGQDRDYVFLLLFLKLQIFH